jgi:DnaJ-class molecular chaperone
MRKVNASFMEQESRRELINQINLYQASGYLYRTDADFKGYVKNLKALAALSKTIECDNCNGEGQFQDDPKLPPIPCAVCRTFG